MLEIFGTDGHIVIEGKQCPQNFNFDIIFFFKEECGGGANKLVSNIITHRKHWSFCVSSRRKSSS